MEQLTSAATIVAIGLAFLFVAIGVTTIAAFGYVIYIFHKISKEDWDGD